MCAHIGEIHPGVVSGVMSKGIFVMLENGIEGFVNLLEIEGTDFEFDGKTTTTDIRSGKSYSIGDVVSIEVINANVATGTIDFAFAEEK